MTHAVAALGARQQYMMPLHYCSGSHGSVLPYIGASKVVWGHTLSARDSIAAFCNEASPTRSPDACQTVHFESGSYKTLQVLLQLDRRQPAGFVAALLPGPGSMQRRQHTPSLPSSTDHGTKQLHFLGHTDAVKGITHLQI